MDVLISGKTSFKVEVPYKLVETGPKGEKPLIVYLHGKGQNIPLFERQVKSMMQINAYHLFIQGPYADFELTKSKEKWGYSWYLYNGRQGSFVKSLEYTAEFIQEIIDHIIKFIKVSRLCVVGYSMGGYMAGYFGTSRWKHTNELIVINGRIKTELLATKWPNLKHQKVLAIHGLKDEIVSPDSQKEHIQKMVANGVDAEFLGVNESHKLSAAMIKKATDWLLKHGYGLIEPIDRK
jgi:predicted esterase